MLFYNQTFMVFILTLIGNCFQKCVANIEENRFTFISTISKNKEPNVFREFTLSVKRILILECSAACRSAKRCVGLDICDGRICRLWNSTNYQSNLSNTSNELCRWYMKSALKENPNDNDKIYHISTENSTITASDLEMTSIEMNLTSQNVDSTTSSTMHSTHGPSTLYDDGTSSSIFTNNATIRLSTSDVGTTSTEMDLTPHNTDSTTSIQRAYTPTTNSTHVSRTINDDMTSNSIPTSSPADGVNVMTFEFSDGQKEVPYHNDSFFWIVIQRRFDGSVDFYRNWAEYENGFGSPQSELWLGNQYIHELTTDGYTVLRIELTSFDGETRHVEYDFNIENKTNNYRLHISERSMSGIDSLERSDLAFFCTFDKDNDNWNALNCADMSEKASGWWHSKTSWCTDGNLNGIYSDQYMNYQQGINWFEWNGAWTLKETKMMLRKP